MWVFIAWVEFYARIKATHPYQLGKTQNPRRHQPILYTPLPRRPKPPPKTSQQAAIKAHSPLFCDTKKHLKSAGKSATPSCCHHYHDKRGRQPEEWARH